jgi:uncharacterized membrane protein
MVQTIDFLFTIYIRSANRKVADSTRLHELVPKINTESLETLLGTISASMLVISILRWARWFQHFRQQVVRLLHSFKLIIGDDVSRNALSVFIGSFIYSIVATVALRLLRHSRKLYIIHIYIVIFCLSNSYFFDG